MRDIFKSDSASHNVDKGRKNGDDDDEDDKDDDEDEWSRRDEDDDDDGDDELSDTKGKGGYQNFNLWILSF